MGIINDNRPRDWTYRVAFNRKDLPSLQEMVKHIRETHDVDAIESFNDKCDQMLTGDNPDFGDKPKPIQITKTDDLVVNGGLQNCINVILGGGTRWSHMDLSIPSGAFTPTVGDTALDNSSGGPFVLSMATYGWMEAKGMKLFFAAIGPQDTNTPLGTNTIKEMGVCNGSAAPPSSTLLNRENFFNNALTRTIAPDLSVYTAVWFFSCVVEFCPVA